MKSMMNKFVFVLLAIAVVSCSKETPKLTPRGEASTENVTQKPLDLTSFNPKVDILFVIDNSGSMADVQANLSRNIRDFSNAITAMSVLDYHIGVVSTDMDFCGGGGGGGASSGACGILAGSPSYVDKNTPNGAAILARNMVLGTSGSATEVMFTPVMEALNGVNNRGFYRQDAYLAVIIITDANEQSRVAPDQFYNFLVNKKGDKNKVLGYGVIRTVANERVCGFQSGERVDAKLEDFLALVVNADKSQNNILSLCDPDYGVRLAAFAADIVKRSSGTVRLLRVPNVKTIRVTYGKQVIPNNPTDGWVYEVSTNSIILAADIKWIDQGPSVGLSIDFEAIE